MSKKRTTRPKSTRPKSTNPKFTRILSIDGGGIRGIIPGQILVALEAKLKKRTNNPNASLAEYFDLVAGTSTGGILACTLLAPQETAGPASRTPRFTAAEAVELYIERGDDVFNVSIWKKIATAGGALDERYDADGLEEVLHDYLDDLELCHLLKPCLITAYDIKRRKAHFFTQHNARKSKGRNFLVREVARATAAAPTYFEVARAKSKSNITYPLVDGGVFANNPTLCAYAEARKLPPNPTAKDMAILSLGTGNVKHAYEYAEAKDWGLLQWVKPVLDIMMTGVAETVDYQLKQIYDAVGCPRQYLRIEPELQGANHEMDDVSAKNLNLLREAGQYAAEKNDKDLEAFVDLLLMTE